MKRVIATLLAFAMTASTHATADATAGATANATAGAEAQLRAQLAAFVEGAAASDAAVHDAFWAEELVYTSSSGTRFGKAELMAGVHASGPADPADVEASYGARDVIVRLVGELGLLDFTLVAFEADGAEQLYLNSGTFVWRDGRWQAVNWQATKAAAAD